MSDEPPPSAIIGTIYAISAGVRGVEISIVSEGQESDSTPPNWGNFTCKLDTSSAYLPMMLELAQTAMKDGLMVYLSGYGDDRDDTLRFNEIRVFAK